MLLQLFYEVITLYDAEINRLNEVLNQALSNDAADQQTIAEFQAKAIEWSNTSAQIQASFNEYKNQDVAEDEQLIDAMNEVKNRLQSAT